MSLKTGLRTLLLARFNIRQLVPDQPVGNLIFPCIFCEDPPQDVKPPFILIQQIDKDPMGALDGTYGMQQEEIDIDCYSFSHDKAEDIAFAVREYLKDFTGLTPTGAYIDAVRWENEQYGKLLLKDGTDTRQRIVSLTFNIFHH